MRELLQNSFFPIFAVAAFLAVVLFVEGLFMIWNAYKGPEAKQIEQRLRALSASSDRSEHAAVLKNRMLSDVPLIERFMLRFPHLGRLDRFILQSGLEWTVGALFFVSLLFGAATYVGLSFVGAIASLKLGLAVATACAPWVFVQWKRHQRLVRIELQLPDAMDLIGRALRAGHALPSGLKMVGDEMADPIGSEFRITHDEINFGVAMDQALNNLSERVPITDLRYFVVAVNIQREAGGNLTEVLTNLSNLIRSRLKFQGRVRVLTTEGRLSAWVLGLLPFALAGLLFFANRKFIEVLWTDPMGIRITNVVLTMMAVGAFWLYRLIKIRM